MSKKKSKVKFVIFSIFLIIGMILSFVKFPIPGTDYVFNGFANSIKLGLDLKGGVLAVYEAKESSNAGESTFASAFDATMKRIQDLVNTKYTEATITKQGADRIRVEVPDVADPKEIFEMIGKPALLEIKKEKTVEAEAVLTGKHIVESKYDNDGKDHGVAVKFNAEGTNIFYDLTKELSQESKSLYIYIGGTFFSEATVKEAISGGSTFISGGMSTKKEAEAYALKILSGTFSVELNLLENSVVSATLGEDALKYGLIAGLLGLILIMIFMWVNYGHFGWIANLSLLMYVVILLFLLQAVPLVQLTLPGIAGIILSIGMAVDANVIIFERIKDEYRSGKKIQPAVITGFKRANVAIIDGNVTTIIAAVVLYLIGTGPIKGFAITLFLGIAVSLFTSLILTKVLVKAYLPLNSTNPKPLNLVREGQ